MESPTIAQLTGIHIQYYESLYKQVDPNNSNHIRAIEAANFLKKSGLSQSTLGKIWDLSDPNGKGFLDKRSLFVALKLIALVQNGKQPSLSDLNLNVLPPKMGEQIDWSISPIDRNKFTDLFNTLNPVDGKLAGNKMKPIMINSQLPVDVLTRIWDLSDTDQDGFLDLQEFILAMHLIGKASENIAMPSVLPPELSNLKRRSSRELWSAFDVSIPATTQLSSITMSPDNSFKNSLSKTGLNTWIVSAADKAKYDEIFQTLDNDFDGYVTGGDVKDTLVQSGLQQNILAHIWNLCDLKENGKLNSEQFALAMYFIKQKQSGIELPQNLSPQMIPPTLRPKPLIGVDNHALESNTQLSNTNGNSNLSVLQTGNKELDGLTEELKELQIEKLKLESEVNQDEAGIKLKQSEIKNLQNEIETLHQMLKQLDTQKSEARKRLEDLGAQSNILENTLHELNQTLKEEKVKVDNLSRQLNEQKLKVDSQESDLIFKRKELEDLKSEEFKLETKLEAYRREAETASKNAGDTQLEMSHIRTKLIELEEYERRLNDAITDIDSAVSSNDFIKINSLLPRTITPPLIETQNMVNQNGFNAFKTEQNQTVLKSNKDTDFVNEDPFAGEDPFKEDPFKSDDKVADPFSSEGFANFGSQDASREQPFDPFGTGSFTTSNKFDPFGSDPFSSQMITPPVRSESPTPALPPKKSKAPPPRPAPPKHASNKAPLRAAPAPPIRSSEEAFKSDSFGSSQAPFDPFNDSKDPFSSSATASGNSFANFANFDKCEIPAPVDPYATLAQIHAESQLISNSKSFDPHSQNFEDSHFVWAFKENI